MKCRFRKLYLSAGILETGFWIFTRGIRCVPSEKFSWTGNERTINNCDGLHQQVDAESPNEMKGT